MAAGLGHAIALEVWRIPSGNIGALLATIPAPLGLGTIRLTDGTTPKGFLVEAEGAVGAEDISQFGGWRGYLAATRLGTLLMDRRTFLATSTATLAAPMLGARRAEAQAPTRAETLLLVQEYGPNSMDMQGIGSSQPVNGGGAQLL